MKWKRYEADDAGREVAYLWFMIKGSWLRVKDTLVAHGS